MSLCLRISAASILPEAHDAIPKSKSVMTRCRPALLSSLQSVRKRETQPTEKTEISKNFALRPLFVYPCVVLWYKAVEVA